MFGRVTCTDPPAAAGVTTCSGKAMTKPDPAVAVPAGTNTATKPGACTEGELIVLTLTPVLELELELELELTAALLGPALTAGSAVVALLAAETVKSGGATL